MIFLCFFVDSVRISAMGTTYVISHFLYLSLNCSATIEVLLYMFYLLAFTRSWYGSHLP